MDAKLNSVDLEILWTRLSSMVDEAATALLRTCFSSVIRDGNDYGCTVFDSEYNLLAQSTLGTPGFVGSLAIAMKAMGRLFPPQGLRPGDVLMTNDPWMCTGHLNDITLITPIFHRARLVAYAICTAHQADIGGRIAVIETREVFEEGLFIPPMKLFSGGEPNDTAFAFIRANVRMPDYVVGDVRAQLAANDVMARRLGQLLDEYDLADLSELSREMLSRTENAMREEVRRLPDGTFRHEVIIDRFDDEPIKICVAVTLANGEAIVDYAGSSSQVTRGINCCYTYTRSYSTFAVKCAINPTVPNNEGVLRVIKVLAPEGSILNAKFPAPVTSRTNVGNFLPEIVFRALAPLVPHRVMAGSGGAPLWAQRFAGRHQNGRPFVLFCVSRGGLGARPTSDGVSALAFPSNTVATPVEIVEGDGPVVFECKELSLNSAGAGKFRGGFGQHVKLKVLEGDMAPAGQVIATAKGGRLHYPVPGILDGQDAPKGVLIADGKPFDVSGKQVILGEGGSIEIFVPGGGGYGDPLERDTGLVEADVRNGFISSEQAKATYGVVMDCNGWDVDATASEHTRSLSRRAKS